MRQMLLRGKTLTAEEALECGIVHEVVWPAKFMETVVPSIEEFEDMPANGLAVVKRGLKGSMRSSLTVQMVDEETKELVRNWTSPKFAKNTRQFLKDNPFTFY